MMECPHCHWNSEPEVNERFQSARCPACHHSSALKEWTQHQWLHHNDILDLCRQFCVEEGYDYDLCHTSAGEFAKKHSPFDGDVDWLKAKFKDHVLWRQRMTPEQAADAFFDSDSKPSACEDCITPGCAKSNSVGWIAAQKKEVNCWKERYMEVCRKHYAVTGVVLDLNIFDDLGALEIVKAGELERHSDELESNIDSLPEYHHGPVVNCQGPEDGDI